MMIPKGRNKRAEGLSLKSRTPFDAGTRVPLRVLWSVDTGVSWGWELTHSTLWEETKSKGPELKRTGAGPQAYSGRSDGLGERQQPRVGRLLGNGSVLQGWGETGERWCSRDIGRELLRSVFQMPTFHSWVLMGVTWLCWRALWCLLQSEHSLLPTTIHFRTESPLWSWRGWKNLIQLRDLEVEA